MKKFKTWSIFNVLILSYILLFFLDVVFKYNNLNVGEVFAEAKAVPTCSLEEINETGEIEGLSSNAIGYPYDNFMQAYFDRLTGNFGFNKKGSCSYIALSIVLSYYDSFLNDSIIAENYDRPGKGLMHNTLLSGRSPGTMNDNYYEPELNEKGEEQDGAKNYYNFLEEYEEKSLHAKLILIGNRHYKTYDFSNNNTPCGTSFSDLIKIANKYLQTERAFNNNEDYSIEYKSKGGSDVIKEFIINRIDAGFPVIVSIGRDRRKDEEGKGKVYHTCVAFAHDDDGNIFLHTGWHGGKRIATINEIGYEFYDEAFTLKFNMPHTHSDNYWVYPNGYDSEPEKYCYCDKRIITYNHTEHTYVLSCDKIDDNTHKAYCVCGESRVEQHDYTDHYDVGLLTGHTAYCKCGASKEEAHLYNEYKARNASFHELRCVCGAIGKKEMHIWTSYNIPGDLHNYVQCKQCLFIRELQDGEKVPIIKSKKRG